MRRLLVLAFIWGWSFLFIKVAVRGMTPTTVAGGRVALGAVVLLAFTRSRGLALPRDRATWGQLTLVALAGNVLPFTLLAWGEERITSALTAVVNATTPLFTAVFVAVLLGERLRRGQIAGLLVGFAGVAVAAGVGADDFTGSSLAGVSASAAAGACYGLTFALMRRHLMGLTPLVAAAGQLTAATVLIAPAAVTTSVLSGFSPTPTRVLSIVLLGAVGTGVAYVLNYRLVAELGPTTTSLVTYLIPVVAVIVGVFVLDEPFELRLVLGGLLVVLGIALVQERLRRPGRPRRMAPVLLLLVALLIGCSDDNGETSACGDVAREAIDPRSTVHVLPGAPEPSYPDDPPTSGPHQVSNAAGVLDEPPTPPVQVGILERGDVLIQYDPEAVDAPDDLAADRVVVAPNAELPSPVVATAWGYRLACESLDVDALESFIDDRAGKGPGGH